MSAFMPAILCGVCFAIGVVVGVLLVKDRYL